MSAQQQAQQGATSSLLKVIGLGVLSLFVVLTIAATIRPFALGSDQTSYAALFTSASRIQPGAAVMVSGIRVGRITSVELQPDSLARVEFSVGSDVPLTTVTRAQLRYLDLVGGRYLALTDDGGSSPKLGAGSTIPVARTTPALDLNALLNGFKPLFAALDPDDVNALAMDILHTFQGEGANVRTLIRRTASLTSTLANRDQLIGDLITNLSTTVATVAARHDQLEQLIANLSQFAVGLARDRAVIGDSLGHIETMTRLSTRLLRDSRPSLKQDIAALRVIARVLSTGGGRKEVVHALDHLPVKLSRMARTASYGSYFNYYVCSVKLRLDSTSQVDPVVRRILDNLTLNDSAKRCDP